jgi:hypothetical protein
MALNLRHSGGLADPGCERPDLALVLPLLAELEPSRRKAVQEHADRCGECGTKLELLTEVDRWLEGQVRRPETGVCPSPEQLYEFAGGPGAQTPSDAERLSVAAHVAGCEDCGGFVETLEQRPPSPLLLDGEIPPPLPMILRRRLAIVAPIAAAAAVVAVMLWNGGAPGTRGPLDGEQASAISYPFDPQLRGRASDALWFPRERVLATDDGPWSELRFEIAEQAKATEYRVVLERNGGGAFDVGEEVAKLEGPERVIPTKLVLEPGHYTWEAWAIVEGLVVSLGSRDFEVVRDLAILAQLEEQDSGSEPGRSETILRILHEAGFLSDARAFARTLPESPERDEYLNRPPAR